MPNPYSRPSPKQLAAVPKAHQLAARLGAQAPGYVTLQDLCDLHTAAWHAGYRVLLFVGHHDRFAVLSTTLAALRRAAPALRRKRAAVLVTHRCISLRWATGALELSCVRDFSDLEPWRQLHIFCSAAGKEEAA
jgi:hypothetical protein